MVLYIFLSELFIVFPDCMKIFCPASSDKPLVSGMTRPFIREENEALRVNTLVRAMRHRRRIPHTK
jgi:hypothetical protein